MSGPTRPPVGFAEWQSRYLALHGAATRIANARRRRAQRLCEQAGLGELAALHNVLAGELAGKPWRGVDYELARQAAAIAARAFEGFHIVERWSERHPLRALAAATAPGDSNPKTPSGKEEHAREPRQR